MSYTPLSCQFAGLLSEGKAKDHGATVGFFLNSNFKMIFLLQNGPNTEKYTKFLHIAWFSLQPDSPGMISPIITHSCLPIMSCKLSGKLKLDHDKPRLLVPGSLHLVKSTAPRFSQLSLNSLLSFTKQNHCFFCSVFKPQF